MSRVYRTLAGLGIVLALAACQSPQPSSPATKSFANDVLGAYSNISVHDAEAESAALFAINMQKRRYGEKLQLGEVVRAERQVVAGLNYRLCLSTRLNGEDRQAVAVVFHNLQKQYSLSIWDWENCK